MVISRDAEVIFFEVGLNINVIWLCVESTLACFFIFNTATAICRCFPKLLT